MSNEPYLLGQTFRLFKSYIANGQTEEARSLLEFNKNLSAFTDDRALISSVWIERFLECSNVIDIYTKCPCFLSLFAFNLGMLAGLENRTSDAVKGLQVAKSLIAHETSIASQYCIEVTSLIKPIERELLLALARDNQSSKSIHAQWAIYQEVVRPVPQEHAYTGMQLIVDLNAKGQYSLVSEILDTLYNSPALKEQITQATSNLIEKKQPAQTSAFNFLVSLFYLALHKKSIEECETELHKLYQYGVKIQSANMQAALAHYTKDFEDLLTNDKVKLKNWLAIKMKYMDAVLSRAEVRNP